MPLKVPKGYASHTDLIFTAGPAFPWLLGAGFVLLALAFSLRRNVWARRALLTLAVLCFVGAWVL